MWCQDVLFVGIHLVVELDKRKEIWDYKIFDGGARLRYHGKADMSVTRWSRHSEITVYPRIVSVFAFNARLQSMVARPSTISKHNSKM